MEDQEKQPSEQQHRLVVLQVNQDAISIQPLFPIRPGEIIILQNASGVQALPAIAAGQEEAAPKEE